MIYIFDIKVTVTFKMLCYPLIFLKSSSFQEIAKEIFYLSVHCSLDYLPFLPCKTLLKIVSEVIFKYILLDFNT